MYNLPFDNYAGEIIYVEEGDSIKLGNDSLKVLLTPGHSPGSLSFYNEEGGFVISGDALFYRSIGRTDLPGGNHAQLLKSIREQLFSLPGNTKVYSGHGQATTIADEINENPFLT
jgi:hydroxyacylglutathione hydrolase